MTASTRDEYLLDDFLLPGSVLDLCNQTMIFSLFVFKINGVADAMGR